MTPGELLPPLLPGEKKQEGGRSAIIAAAIFQEVEAFQGEDEEVMGGERE